MARFTKFYIERIVSEIQNLEEMGGPDSLEQYIAVLTAVKQDIDKRISSASEQLIEAESQK